MSSSATARLHAIPSRPWQDLPVTAETHFRLHFFGAVFRVLAHVRRSTDAKGVERQFARFPFLTAYLEVIRPSLPDGLDWESSLQWWSESLEVWEAQADRTGVSLTGETAPTSGPASSPTTPLLPLRELRRLGLSSHALALLLLMGLVEEDARFGGLFAELQAPLVSRRPCLELLRQLLAPPPEAGEIGALARQLQDTGLVELLAKDLPRAEWVMRIPTQLWELVRGRRELPEQPGLRFEPPEALAPLERLIVPPTLLARLQQLPALWNSDAPGTAPEPAAQGGQTYRPGDGAFQGRVDTLILRGIVGSHREEVMGAVARGLGRGFLRIHASLQAGDSTPGAGQNLKVSDGAGGLLPFAQLGALCTLLRALPVIVLDLSPGETVELPTLPGYAGPLAVLLGPEGGLTGPRMRRALTLELPYAGYDARLQAWQQALAQDPNHATSRELEAIAGRFLLPLGHLRQVAQQGLALAALEKRSELRLQDVREASEALNRQQLDALAHRLQPEGDWDRLVVSRPILDKLQELEHRCRHREQVTVGRGFGSSGPRGVRALFTGPSGTGKTLAAQVLTARLDKSLYRVDLASVVNKYIGETEKNLHQVLSRAEALDVVLLIDEGDALLGNRTQVRSANDRYANLETNYLLQRIEHYQGIVIVTTNAADHIDSAFQRRMDVVVSFLHPQPDERRRIWKLHLPEKHAVSVPMLEQISRRCALNGGQIRNAALHASLLAVEGPGLVRDGDLEAAIYSEYRKAGAVCPLQPAGRGTEPRGMAGFVSLLRDKGRPPTGG